MPNTGAPEKQRHAPFQQENSPAQGRARSQELKGRLNASFLMSTQMSVIIQQNGQTLGVVQRVDILHGIGPEVASAPLGIAPQL